MGRRKTHVKQKPKTVGQKTLLVNRSDNENYCAQSGQLLPRKGMIVVHNGKQYVGYKEAELDSSG